MKINSALAVLLLLFCGAIYALMAPKPPTELTPFINISYSDFKSWKKDNHQKALESFQISCGRIINYDDDRDFKSFGLAKDWKGVCQKALSVNNYDDYQARVFFESNFDPVTYREKEVGLFTGYYAPLYKGSRTKSDVYSAPLYAMPKDLQALNLGDFDLSLKGKSIVGEVKDKKFIPYKDRKQIDLGALENQQLELVWLEKIEETFFLQIQGSGFIELDDGELMHLGYAQKNGRPYRAIGQYLIESGDISRTDMSLQAILNWMEENPEKSSELMWKNPSYVFFQERTNDKPVGSLGVGLTPGRSLAVDREFIPLGMPLWLETYIESEDEQAANNEHLNRLVIAQDTGGAIKGKTRGDVYWGIGDQAELKAGPMKDKGTYYMLVPKTITQSLTTNLQSAP